MSAGKEAWGDAFGDTGAFLPNRVAEGTPAMAVRVRGLDSAGR